MIEFSIPRKDPEEIDLYSYLPVNEFKVSMLPKVKPSKKEKILKIGAAFDIETTSYHSEKYDKDLATMYIWQFGIGSLTIIGRTWDEFTQLIEKLSDWAGKLKGTLLILDHNFSFEFSFIKSLFDWDIDERTGYPAIFAKSPRDILYAKYKNVEFRDTLALTDMGLARLPKNYGLIVEKLVGDLDYDLKRHTKTPLTNQELAYCINDVKVLVNFFYAYLMPNYIEKELKIPLTSTGEVRIDIKNNFSEMSKEERKLMRNELKNAQPSREMYQIFREWLFRGGYVHANILACNYLFKFDDSASMDLKSAHPTHMLLDNFPWKFYRRNMRKWKEVYKSAKTGKTAFFGSFTFKNIRCKTAHALESKNKIVDAVKPTFENGRLVYSEEITVYLTELDMWNYEDLYIWDKMSLNCLYEAEKRPLPDYLRKTVLRYFEKKETLERDTPDYNSAKRRLNSTFGCCATSLPERSFVYNPNVRDFKPSKDVKQYEDLIKGLYLLPQWAIYIAAGTRRDIIRSMVACGENGNGEDSFYQDTDSNKVNNYSKYKPWFDEFNKERMEAVAAMETYDFNKEHFKYLGTFQKEYTMTKAKFLGCKRYVVEHDGHIQVTIAGMVKGSLENYCEKNNLNIWDKFKDELVLTPKWSRKKTSVYCDQDFEDYLVDYLGQGEIIKEGSSCAIVPIPFTMNVEAAFLKRIEQRMLERSIMVHKDSL